MIDPITMLRSKIQDRSLRVAAKDFSCSAAYLSDILRGNRKPGPKILKVLGLDRTVDTTVVYKRKRGANG